MKIQNKKTYIVVLILVTIDQVIKIVINNNFLDKRSTILPHLLYFEPMFNRHYSWFNSMLQLGISKYIHISLVAIMSILIYLFYQYLNKQFGTNKTINSMYAFIFSGAMCSLIDKIFWNGSLDYILVNGFFTFDLKDVYINIFVGLLILTLLLKNKVLDQIDDNIVKDFTEYILRKL
ncbi:signal peptidase II [Clostridium sp. CM027]|uniref:signal peptidase II n=1 Tax=Clostridium sp. CM027 TaxID=2849865 RepID=UPI001C6E2ECF|nr:signal peptidase II [Clostridium sp. CM027]MBW9145839.1 signal peptidase II [Clostridium sp. CM027]UVE42099.1 signal peptidase II [Clostridium sp. CM027]